MIFSVDSLEKFTPSSKSSRKTFVNDFINRILGIENPNSLCDDAWWIEPVFSGKRSWKAGFDPITSEILTSFGQVGGKMQNTRRQIEENSSGRSVLEQAFISLKQKYKLKMSKEGFKCGSADDDVDVECVNVEEKGETSDKNASRTSENEERPFPMLAKTFDKPLKEKDFPIFTQPKIDGVRVLVDFDGKGEMRFSSRARNDFTYLKDIFNSVLDSIFESLQTFTSIDKTNLVLDGELSIKNKDGVDDFQTTISAVKKVKGGLKDDAKENLKMCIFTFFTKETTPSSSLTFSSRSETMFKINETFKGQDKIIFVQTDVISSPDEIEKKHGEYVSSGFEGLMIYLKNGIYEPNKRSSFLLKYKKFNDSEGKIVGVRAGKGRESNAAMVDIEVSKGVVITMHPKGEIKEREEWLKNPSLVLGKMMTYTFQGLTAKGIPRFPVAVAIRDYE